MYQNRETIDQTDKTRQGRVPRRKQKVHAY